MLGATIDRLPFDAAILINANASHERRARMERQVSGITYELWPALHGAPSMLTTHASYLQRGVDAYLRKPNKRDEIRGWGTVGNYLTHLTLLEHLLLRGRQDDVYLILQDDLVLAHDWLRRLQRTRKLLDQQHESWQRCLLVWFGAERPEHCDADFCRVTPPAGPMNGTRFYHGLQATLVRARGLACMVERLRHRHIKSIDAVLVDAGCPGEFALRKGGMLGVHRDTATGSESAARNHGSERSSRIPDQQPRIQAA